MMIFPYRIFVRVEIVFADARPQRRDHRPDFLVPEHLVVARLLDVQDFALQRQDRLEPPVPPLLGRPAGRFALHQEQLAPLRIPLLAVRQLVRHPARFQRAFAPRQVASLPRGLARPRRLDRLADNRPAHLRVLVEVLRQLLVDELRHVPRNVAVQLALGLPFELRLRHLHADHRRQTLANVVAREILFHVLEQPFALSERVDRARQRRVKAAQVRAAVHRVDVVREAQNVLGVRVVVLERDLHPQRAVRQLALAFEIDRLVVQDRLAAVQVLDELRDAAAEDEFGRLLRIHALVRQRDLEALVQKRQLPQPRRQRVVIEYRDLHDGGVGLERDARAGLPARLAHLAPAAPSESRTSTPAATCSRRTRSPAPAARRAHSRSSRPRRATRPTPCSFSNRTCRRRAASSSPPAPPTLLLPRESPPECRGRCRSP